MGSRPATRGLRGVARADAQLGMARSRMVAASCLARLCPLL